MEKLIFNQGWYFARLQNAENGGTMQPVTLPHDAMLAEPRTPESAGGTNTGWFAGADYLYEKTFIAPTGWAGQQVLVAFEGVYHRAEVWLNGEQLSFFPNGYLPFRVDLTRHLRYGQPNTLRVIARNADQPNSRWYSGAGIYRSVWLLLLPQAHLDPDGVKIRTRDYTVPSIEVELCSASSGEACVEILDGETVLSRQTISLSGQASLPLDLPGAQLWSPEHPKRYLCRVRFGEDVREEWFGIREVRCDAKQGFRLNGQHIILRGACVHHDNGLLGAVSHPFAEERKVRLLMQAGYNAIRAAHNPCSPALLDACDRLGMLVVDEYADMWYIHKTRYDYATYLPERWRQDLEILVNRDFNHPSVVMYSIGNEVSETAQKRGIELTGKMVDYLHMVDDRPVTCGVNIFFNFLSSMGLGVYSDKNAEKEARQAEKRKGTTGKKKAVGSEFFNNLAGLAGSGFMKFGATLHGSDVKTRDAYARMDVAGYNYGIKRYRKDFRRYPDRVILGSETFCSDAYQFWELAKQHPALIGDFVWSGMDYIGECGIGAWEYKDYAPEFDHGVGWLTAGAGRLDITGRPNGEAAYTQVAFELSPIRIGVVPADHAGDPHSPSAWRMTNTWESWSWNGCEGKKTEVEVYARGARIALFLNGEKLGEKVPKGDCRVVFPVTYRPGVLMAVAYDADGTELCRTSLQSAQGDTQLTLCPEQPVVTPEELCYVRLQYTDSEGTLKPLTRGKIHVSVKGGTLLGLGNGCPYNETGYLTAGTDTYYGEALAIVRPDGPGTVQVTAESRLGTAQAQIVCK